MIQSMTGFGKSCNTIGNKTITVTIKTLNSKQQDTYIRIPSLYKDNEIEIKSIILDRLFRGKIDCSITIDESAVTAVYDIQPINKDIISYYVDVINELSLSNPNIEFPNWVDIMKLPGVLSPKQEKVINEAIQEDLECLYNSIKEAVEQVVIFRKQEGEMLYSVIKENIKNISNLLLSIDRPEKERIALLRERIEGSIQKVTSEYDKNRFEQEMIYYIERIDINEEKTRLDNHLKYFIETLDNDDISKGKTLGFIAQEIGREINTLGSKSNNAEMQQIVVNMKDNLEQIKEQILNVL